MKINLENFICVTPFYELEIQEHDYFFCCASWLPIKVSTSEYSIKDIWNSDPAKEIRNSILNGSYKYCDKKLCPHLSKLVNFGIESGTIFHKNKPSINFKKHIKNGDKDTPGFININIDRSCNFKCPSCRKDIIFDNNKKAAQTLIEIENSFAETLESFCITGVGDPFVSIAYRNFLRNFNPKKYKKLEKIHLHTNASLWTEEMWNSMPNIHPYVKSCEVSIDAGTKETYENIVRLNGNWDILMERLEFIKSIKTIGEIRVSFVVQQANYKEMSIFADLMYNILGNKANIFFGRINNWGTFTPEEFEKINVIDPNHPEHELFIEEVNKIDKKPRVRHNLYEFLKPTEKKYLI